MDAWLRRRARQVVGGTAVVTHGRCLDGLAAAALLRRAYPDARSFHVQHDELAGVLEAIAEAVDAARADGAAGTTPWGPPASGPATAVFITDLSPGPDVARTAAALDRLGPVFWLDHHAPQWPDATTRHLGAHVHRLIVDRTGAESGTSLVLRLLQEGDPRLPPPAATFDEPELLRAVDAVRRRDTWDEPDELGTRLMTVSRRLRDEDFIALFAAGHFDALRTLSKQPYRRHERALARAMDRFVDAAPGVAFLWGRAPFSDAAAALLAARPDIQVALNVRPDGGLGIRSRGGEAAVIAQALGGGGHAQAAGARLVHGRWRIWWLRRRRARHRAVRRALSIAAAQTRAAPTGDEGTALAG